MSHEGAVAYFLKELARERSREVLGLAATRRRASIVNRRHPRVDSQRWSHRYEACKARSRLYLYAVVFGVPKDDVRAAVREAYRMSRPSIDRYRATMANEREERRKVEA